MHKGFLVTAALLGALSVALGAFGAHALKETLSEQSLNTYETAVRYQFYHVFALALAGILRGYFPDSKIRIAGILFIAGIIVFSGSLYLLVSLPDMRWLGAITPIGGLCFIGGWIMLALGVATSGNKKN
jgi:uncharacterized membrane protein YgdD (TMEM256/DUF423 family)